LCHLIKRARLNGQDNQTGMYIRTAIAVLTEES